MNIGPEKRLLWTLAITFVIFAAEVAGGIISNSLALLSDAGHVLTDSFALIMSLIALLIMKRPSDHRATYGYQRIGLLAALVNGVSLVVIAVVIFAESYKRMMTPPEIQSSIMLGIAGIGLAGNIGMALILGGRHADLNLRSAWLHVLGDTLSSAAVIVAGVIIRFTGWTIVDPVASILVGVMIVSGGLRVIKEALWVFLELSPLGFHAEEISERIAGIQGVQGVHDVHIWSIGHGLPAFSGHVLVCDQSISEADKIRKKIEETLLNIGIRHSVIQMEATGCGSDGLYCSVDYAHMPDMQYSHHPAHTHDRSASENTH